MRAVLRLLRTRPGRIGALAVVLSLLSFGISLTLIQVPVAQAALPEETFQPVPGVVEREVEQLADGSDVGVRMGMRDPVPTQDRSFEVQGVRSATGLVQAEDEQGHILGLVLLPKPTQAEVAQVTVSLESTAVTLAALNPGLLTADPELDLLVAHEIAQLPELPELVSALRADAAEHGATYLQNPSPRTLTAVGSVVAALPAALSARAASLRGSTGAAPGESPAEPAPEPEPDEEPVAPARSCDGPGIAPVDGLEGDDVCVGVRGRTAAKGEEPERVELRAVNRSPRWALVRDSENTLPRALQPKEWIIPSLAALGSAVSSALANSKDANEAKELLDGFGELVGVDYRPYYGADSFLTALNLQLQRFGKDRVTDLARMPVPQDRALQVVSFAYPRGDVGRAHPVLSGAAFVGTITSVVVVPLVKIVLDLRSARNDVRDEVAARNDRGDSDSDAASGSDAAPDASTEPDAEQSDPEPGDPAAGDAAAEEGCQEQVRALLDLATELQGPLDDLTRGLSAAGDNAGRAKALVQALPPTIVTLLSNADTLGCLLGGEAWELSKQGALGPAVKALVETLDKNDVKSFGAAFTVLSTGKMPNGKPIDQALRETLIDAARGLLAEVVTALVEKVVTKLAMVIAPGGQLLFAVKVGQQAPDIGGWALSMVDLFQTITERADGSDYRLASGAAIDTTLARYPDEVSSDAKVDYAPIWYGTAGDLGEPVDGREVPGFWVSGVGQLDAFRPSGKKGYSFAVRSDPDGLHVSKFDDGGKQLFSVLHPAAGGGELRLLLPDKSQNLYVYQGGVGGGSWIFDGDDGSMLVDVGKAKDDAGLGAGVFSILGTGGWWLTGPKLVNVAGNASLVVDTATGAATPVDRGLDLGGTSYQTPDGRSLYLETDGTVVLLDGSTLREVAELPHAPVQNNFGVDDPTCRGYWTFATSDGLVAAMTAQASVWSRHVDPRQDGREGNRATHSTVDPKTCAVFAADDHGVLSRIESNGKAVWDRRFAHYSQADEDTGGSYPISGLSRAGGVVTAVSDVDPHIVAFDAATGDNVWAFALPSANRFLLNLTPDVLLAVGVDGDLTVLDTR